MFCGATASTTTCLALLSDASFSDLFLFFSDMMLSVLRLSCPTVSLRPLPLFWAWKRRGNIFFSVLSYRWGRFPRYLPHHPTLIWQAVERVRSS